MNTTKITYTFEIPTKHFQFVEKSWRRKTENNYGLADVLEITLNEAVKKISPQATFTIKYNEFFPLHPITIIKEE